MSQESSQVKSSQVKSSQVKSSQVKSSQVKSSQVDEHARFRINRLVITILMRHYRGQVHREHEGAELIRRYLEPENAPQHILREHRLGIVHRQQVGRPVQHLLHHRRIYRCSEFARRFDGKKHIATVTEHATQQIKEVTRRFDGKK